MQLLRKCGFFLSCATHSAYRLGVNVFIVHTYLWYVEEKLRLALTLTPLSTLLLFLPSQCMYFTCTQSISSVQKACNISLTYGALLHTHNTHIMYNTPQIEQQYPFIYLGYLCIDNISSALTFTSSRHPTFVRMCVMVMVREEPVRFQRQGKKNMKKTEKEIAVEKERKLHRPINI